jgi:hypothetical protein
MEVDIFFVPLPSFMGKPDSDVGFRVIQDGERDGAGEAEKVDVIGVAFDLLLPDLDFEGEPAGEPAVTAFFGKRIGRGRELLAVELPLLAVFLYPVDRGGSESDFPPLFFTFDPFVFAYFLYGKIIGKKRIIAFHEALLSYAANYNKNFVYLKGKGKKVGAPPSALYKQRRGGYNNPLDIPPASRREVRRENSGAAGFLKSVPLNEGGKDDAPQSKR